MFVMATSTYPPDKATEVAKAFMELPEPPSFVKLLHVLITTAGEDGIKTYGLYEVENKKRMKDLWQYRIDLLHSSRL